MRFAAIPNRRLCSASRRSRNGPAASRNAWASGSRSTRTVGSGTGRVYAATDRRIRRGAGLPGGAFLRHAGMYSGAASAQMTPPTTIAVDTLVPSASAARTMPPSAPAGWAIIEFIESTVVRCEPSTCQWSNVVCIGFDAPWTM